MMSELIIRDIKNKKYKYLEIDIFIKNKIFICK